MRLLADWQQGRGLMAWQTVLLALHGVCRQASTFPYIEAADGNNQVEHEALVGRSGCVWVCVLMTCTVACGGCTLVCSLLFLYLALTVWAFPQLSEQS